MECKRTWAYMGPNAGPKVNVYIYIMNLCVYFCLSGLSVGRRILFGGSGVRFQSI